MGYKVSRDGRTLATFDDANSAYVWLLRHQGQSVHHATTYEGYSIDETADYARSDERARREGLALGNEVVDGADRRLVLGTMSERQRRIFLAAVVESVVDHLAYAVEDEGYTLTDKGRQAIGA